MTRQPDLRDNLCPDRRHQIRVAANASFALRGLDPALRSRLVEMLCDVAEVDALAPGAVDFQRSGLLAIRVGRSVALYSLDATHAVTVHHVIEAEALPRMA